MPPPPERGDTPSPLRAPSPSSRAVYSDAVPRGERHFMSDEMEQVVVSESGPGSRSHLWPRLALVQAVLLMAAVVIALPIAFRSMGILLTDGQARTHYDFPTGQAVTADTTAALAESESYFNIAAIDLDEDLGSITMAVSGHRICPDDVCSTLEFTLVSLEDDAAVRRALPPSAAL